jgi:hypothetical protein
MPKTEAELIETVANIPDAARCLLFAQRARDAGMLALAAACEERARVLKPARISGSFKRVTASRHKAGKTNAVAEQALPMLISDYIGGLPPTTYGELLKRCGIEEKQGNARWFGQVTDLIDAACALADLPSFALVRVREANGKINKAAWTTNSFSHLRERIVARAEAGQWSEKDFTKIYDALADFTARGLGNKKAWEYVRTKIKMEDWAR